MKTEDLASLTRAVRLADLDTEARHEAIDVDAADRASLSEAYDVTDIAVLKGDMDVRRSGTLVTVAGTLEADLGRTCVVSLEPMREVIHEHFAVEYTGDPQYTDEEEAEADLDAPEPIEGDSLDLGQVLLEQLVLAMSPHPRKEDATPPDDLGKPAESSPFDVLKSLKT